MSRRSRADRDRTAPAAAPTDGQAALDASSNRGTSGQQPVAGMIAGTTVRSGEDTRRRGWFWHWNSIVTQYAPLIGLKGVGLLNSYTVWTDRREESPHRGYAFPSQQSEADFYGEDRAELITINKILVALDLIEIRKEMVLRADEQGRRWRVPHNFYRVKDHDDDFNLNSDAVLRVVELADRDKTVYRYIRRIFSPRFSPIDPDNVWHRILPELRQTEPWRRLAARAEHEEDRASARTRAGHASRKTSSRQRRVSNDGTPDIGMPASDDNATPTTAGNDSGTGGKKRGRATSVATTNIGLSPDVEPANNGLTDDSPTRVDPANKGEATAVARTNRMYNQSPLTTTTTTGTERTSDESQPVTASEESPPTPATPVTTPLTALDMPATTSTGPGGQTAPVDVVGEATAIRTYEDANGRKASPAERTLLRQLAERFEPSARLSGQPGRDSGYGWIVAAIYEAVEAGSAYVAPRRIREIMTRWEREGIPGTETALRAPHPAGEPDAAAVEAQRGGERRDPEESVVLGSGPDLALPHGFGSRRTWEFTVGLLSATLDRERLSELVTGTWIAGYQDGEVTLAAPSAVQADRLTGEYRDLVVRKLSEAMRRPVRLAVLTGAPPEDDMSATGPRSVDPSIEEVDAVAHPTSFMVAECGLPSGQVWAAVLDEVLQSGEISRANFDAWLRSTVLLGRDAHGEFIVGAPHTIALRRIDSRFLPTLRKAMAAVIGGPASIDVVIGADWLQEQGGATSRQIPFGEHRQRA